MKIVVTGALGVLGRAVQALLAGEHALVLLDQRPGAAVSPSPAQQITVADIRQPGSYRECLRGATAVVHLASLHGLDHMSRFAAADFWSVNVDGTRVLYDAAAQAGVTHIVLASSMAVYGPIPGPAQREWVRRTERTPTRPHDVYVLTKIICEQVAEYHGFGSSMATTVLRFGHFTPAPLASYGFRLLFGGVDVRDAAAAVKSALASPPGRGRVRRLNIHAPSPLTDVPLEQLAAGAAALVRQRYPGLAQHVRCRGEDLEQLLWGRSVWPIDIAREQIGYQPEYTFERFADSYCRDDDSGYAPLFWHRWGVDELPRRTRAAAADNPL